MKRTALFLPVLALIFFAACEKEEKAYTLPAPGNAVVEQINMGSDYSKVIFYNLIEELADWDLALESTTDGYRALINGGTGVQVAPMGDTSFNALYDIDNATWKWDPPSFLIDSTAIGEWSNNKFITTREVYLLDRSVNSSFEQYKKLQLLEVTDTYYLIRTASLDGSNDQVIRINKDPNVSYVYVHLENGPLAKYEPRKEEWDFMFTRYRYVYYDMTPIIPYEVNGVVLNAHNVSAAETRMAFDSITLEEAMKLNFTSRRDFIGFDWKYYDFDKEAYITDIGRVLLIRSHSGIYFKLRFIDFYDADGVKGAPTFEFQRL